MGMKVKSEKVKSEREEGDDAMHRPLVKQRGSSRRLLAPHTTTARGVHMSPPRPTTPRRAGITPCSKDYASNP